MISLLRMNALGLLLCSLCCLIAANSETLPHETEECNPVTNGFYCYRNNECIALYGRCDGEVDCLNGEDEIGCPVCNDTISAQQAGKFFCPPHGDTDGSCIDRAWVCDGAPDCDGGQDEQPEHCRDIVCSVDDQFQCETGQCITKTWQCDGQEDCADGSDEKDCSAKQCDPTNQYQCPADPSAGYEATCINLTWKCDGEPDCPNGEDEVGCAERTCESGRFLCQESANKTACLPKRWKCDGDVDCLDGVDEQGCDSAPAHEVNRGGCTEGLEFQCHSGALTCILDVWRCDNEDDCDDGSDELGCPNAMPTCQNGQFLCKADRRCIPGILRCSGQNECSDGADEEGCNTPHTDLCSLGDKKIMCPNEKKCINFDQFCDSRHDCQDQSDEQCLKQDLCVGVDCGEGGNCVTQQNTAGYAITHQCVCRSGFTLDFNTKMCKDINECEAQPPKCDQLCKNTVGSYHCECQQGYGLMADGISCKVQQPENVAHPRLLFTNRHEIRSLHMHERNSEYMPIMDAKSAVAIDFDVSNGTVYYSDVTEQKIFKFNLGHLQNDPEELPAPTELNLPDVVTPDGLAFDWVYKHLYWTDTATNTIHMACPEDAENPMKVILYENSDANCVTDPTDTSVPPSPVCIDEPRALAMHPERGWLFWSDWGANPHIVRANMDGSGMEKIAFNTDSDTYLQWPNGVTLDMVGDRQRLYWIDAKLSSVYSCQIDDCQDSIRLVVFDTENIRHPYSITVFESMLYWSDWGLQGVVRTNKHTGDQTESIVTNLDQPMDLKVYHHMSQPKSPNLCLNSPCEQICVPKPWIRAANNEYRAPQAPHTVFTCMCQQDFKLAADGHKCEPIVTPNVPTASLNVVKVSQTKEANTTGSIGVIAGITIAAVIGVGACVGATMYIVVRRLKQNRNKSMNFDNPVYKRTTEDKLELPRNEYQPDQSEPSSMIPLTSSSDEHLQDV